MALTGTKCIQHIEHTLGGELSPAIDGLSLVNDAGEFFASFRPWKWLETATAKIDLRAPISIAAATTSSGAGTTFTKSGAFTNYTFVEGDQLEVTGGTNVTVGHYRVQSKTDANNIVLAVSPGASGSAVAATLHTDAASFPSDFRELISIDATSGVFQGFQFVSMSELLSLRSNNLKSGNMGYYYGAIVQPTDTDTSYDGAPVARLELWPQPSANETGKLSIIYRAGWKRAEETKDYLRLPVYCEPLFLQVVRAFARGYEEEDGGSLTQRLADVMGGHLAAAAIDRDASIQPHYGPLNGGAASKRREFSRHTFHNYNSPIG